jgi:hypothetical protein
MVVETLYVGRNNTFSLQLVRGGSPITLLAILGYELNLSNGLVFNDPALFVEKDDGIVEISIGSLLTADDTGIHTAYLITFDPVNTNGVRWPKFKLKVLE